VSAVRRRIVLGLALGLTVGVLVGVLNRRDDLLARATRIRVPDGLITGERIYAGYRHHYHHVPSYAWSSATSLVAVRGAGPSEREIVRLDTRDGTLVASQRSGVPGTGQLSGSFYWIFSPSGDRVLALADSGRNVICAVSTLEGEGVHSWTNRIDAGFEPTWLADGSGFVLWDGQVGAIRARVHEIESGVVREFRLDQAPIEVPAGAETLGRHRAMVPRNLIGSESAVEFLELLNNKGEWTATRRRIRVPERLRAAGARAFASPTGDRLVWLGKFDWRIPGFKRIPTFPFLSAGRRSTHCLFVSAPDGSGLRQLGPFLGEEEIADIAWTPDGGRLSFFRAGALWTVPADQP